MNKKQLFAAASILIPLTALVVVGASYERPEKVAYVASSVTPTEKTVGKNQGKFVTKEGDPVEMSVTSDVHLGIEAWLYVIWADGIKQNFGDLSDDSRVQTVVTGVDGNTTYTDGSYYLVGDTFVFKSENATTYIGGVGNELRSGIASVRGQREARRHAQREAESESFNQYISRISKGVCQNLEDDHRINSKNVYETALGLTRILAGSKANYERLSNMNRQVALNHIVGAMNYDCSHITSVIRETDLNDSIDRAVGEAIGGAVLLNMFN